VWTGDITYLWTREGWLYLAVFLDLFSRRVVGWAVAKTIDTWLVSMAFQRAVARRSPEAGLIVHSDRGVQYASSEFRTLLANHGAVQSMSRKGDCWDNAVVESFFHSLKVEAIHGLDFQTRKEAEFEVFDYIERFYNRTRRHSYLGFLAPEVFEKRKTTSRGLNNPLNGAGGRS
jgi:transposase InsO family protein